MSGTQNPAQEPAATAFEHKEILLCSKCVVRPEKRLL